MSREDRIESEIKRLTKLFKDIDEDKVQLVKGLIRRAAFMMVSLEDLEDDINNNGVVEEFSQTANISYDRERPAAKTYISLSKNYHTTMKELIGILPKETAKQVEDDLLSFIGK